MVYRNRVLIQDPAPEALAQAQQMASMFTNELDEQRLSNAEVLRAYKEQHEVEGRFRFLKSPYFVGPVYLQNPGRVESFVNSSIRNSPRSITCICRIPGESSRLGA
ncbi:hypothetical protein GCM10010885_24700 [Alicyclobacillus cellulosilyticus]|uniref:Uncharacterized protein n=1 Tax=Alicyclobacillus cellulosilyticus TaxID=1003997 RepID=A0A917NNY9_9BACL|nr:hypothetical protein GCM10010885_24700 [Alicyclobacillus cellulosilyticus]